MVYANGKMAEGTSPKLKEHLIEPQPDNSTDNPGIEMISDKIDEDYQPLQEDDELDVESPERTNSPSQDVAPVSTLWLYILSIANLGIGSAWALEFAVVTPYFENGLMAGSVISHGVWIAGPLSGLIVAPIVGAMSDRCTSQYGRRRPYIVGGLIATVLGMLMFSNAREIATLFFNTGSNGHHVTAIIIAVITFCILIWPSIPRCGLADLVPESQQHDIQSASVAMISLGDFAVNAMVESFDEPITRIRWIFAVAALFYSCTVLTLLHVGRETPLAPDDFAIKNAEPPTLNVLSYLRGLPSWMWRIGGTYAFGFFSFFCVLPFFSSWIGSSVLGGDPKAPEGSKEALLYEKGVNLYGQSGMIRGPLQIVTSVLYPKLLQCGIAPGPLFASVWVLFSTFLIFVAQTNSARLSQAAVIMFAMPKALLLTLPVGVTVALSDESNRGRYLGALNIFAVIPQLIDTVYTGIISKAFGESMVMYIGAGWGLVTALWALFFLTDK